MSTDFVSLVGLPGQTPWYDLWVQLMTMLDETFDALVAQGYTSATNTTVGTGLKTFTTDQDTTGVEDGQLLVCYSMQSRGAIMVGEVVGVTTNSISILVTLKSGSGSYVDWVIVPAAVFPTAPQRIVTPVTANYAVTSNDIGSVIEVTSATPVTITLLQAGATGVMVGSGWPVTVKSLGVGAVTLLATGASPVDGNSSILLIQNQGVDLVVNAASSGYDVISAIGYGSSANGGAATPAMSGDITLTFGSSRLQVLNPTGEFLSVFLPDATTYPAAQMGGPVFSFSNIGAYPAVIRNSVGAFIGAVDAFSTASAFLGSNSSAAGVWSMEGGDSVLSAVCWENFIATTYTDCLGSIALATNSILVILKNASGALFGVMLDPTTRTIGTVTSIDATASSSVARLLKIDSTHALLLYLTGTTSTARVITVSGLTLTPATKTDSPLGTTTVYVAQQICSLSTTLVLVVFNNSGPKALAISVSGTTVTWTAAQFTITGSSGAPFGRLQTIDATHAAVITPDTAGTGSLLTVLGVSGTTISVTTSAALASITSVSMTVMSATLLILSWVASSQWKVQAYTFNGSALSGGTVSTNTTDTWVGIMPATNDVLPVTAFGSSDFIACAYWSDGSNQVFSGIAFGVSGNTLTPGPLVEYMSGAFTNVDAGNQGAQSYSSEGIMNYGLFSGSGFAITQSLIVWSTKPGSQRIDTYARIPFNRGYSPPVSGFTIPNSASGQPASNNFVRNGKVFFFINQFTNVSTPCAPGDWRMFKMTAGRIKELNPQFQRLSAIGQRFGVVNGNVSVVDSSRIVCGVPRTQWMGSNSTGLSIIVIEHIQ